MCAQGREDSKEDDVKEEKEREAGSGQVMSSCGSSHWGHEVTDQGCHIGDVIASSHGEVERRAG